jgi:hypothetical protein
MPRRPVNVQRLPPGSAHQTPRLSAHIPTNVYPQLKQNSPLRVAHSGQTEPLKNRMRSLDLINAPHPN